MSQLNNEIEIICNSGLGGDTPLIIGNQMISISQLHLRYADHPVTSFAVNTNTFQMDECYILDAPQEFYTPSIVRIGLYYGQYFECTPGSLILTEEGFKRADSIKKDDNLKVLYFNQTSGESKIELATITKYEYEPSLDLQIPVYMFNSEFENILLPYYKEGAEVAAFVNIKQ